MINWFNMPDEGLSNGGLFEVKELNVTENGTYEQSGEMYNKVTVNVEGGGGGSSDFSTAEVTITNTAEFTTIDFLGINISNDIMISDAFIEEGTTVLTVLLYKGSQAVSLNMETLTSMSGNITGNVDDGFVITGDCSVVGVGYGMG